MGDKEKDKEMYIPAMYIAFVWISNNDGSVAKLQYWQLRTFDREMWGLSLENYIYIYVSLIKGNFQCTNHACKYIIDISINFQRLSLNFVYESVNFQKVLKGNITKKYELIITRSTMKQVCEEENLTHQKMVFPGAFGLVNL